MTVTDLDRLQPLGGEAFVGAVMHEFVHRAAGDFIIGFLFVGRDLDRIVRHETELAVAHLGGPATYRGRPIGAVHRPLKINRGHFRRRLAILRTVLGERGAPPDVVDRWLAHDAALEPVVTDGTDCGPPSGHGGQNVDGGSDT